MSAYTAGTLLVLVAAGEGNTDNTVTGPAGWTVGPYAAHNADVGLWWRLSSGASTTVTITAAANTRLGMEVYEISGLLNTLDKTATNVATTTQTSLPTGTTATLASPAQLCIAGFTAQGPTVEFISAYSGGYSARGSIAVGDSAWLDVASLVVQSTAAQSCTATVTSSAGPAALIATFPLAIPVSKSIIKQQATNCSYSY
jgi:hypothetical protein